MSYTESLTQTYTIADIGKVIDCFAADLDMTSQSTGLLTQGSGETICGGREGDGPEGLPAGSKHRAEGFRGQRDPRGQIRSIHRCFELSPPAVPVTIAGPRRRAAN